MKVSIKIDCTPQEARSFLGLPDVQSFQQEMVDLMKKRTEEHLASMDPEAMMKTWWPMGMEAANAMQQAFMGSFKPTSNAGKKKG